MYTTIRLFHGTCQILPFYWYLEIQHMSVEFLVHFLRGMQSVSFQPHISRTTLCNSLMDDFWHNSKFLYSWRIQNLCIRVYKEIWERVIYQVLPCIQETENPKDRNAVTLMNKKNNVGNVPKNISVWMTMFLKLKNSSIASRATGKK